MADEAFRPFTSLLLSAPAVAEQHASSSDNNLPSPSESLPRNAPAGFKIGSQQDYALRDEAGTSMHRSGEGDELVSSSSDSEEDDDAEEDVSGDASAMER